MTVQDEDTEVVIDITSSKAQIENHDVQSFIIVLADKIAETGFSVNSFELTGEKTPGNLMQAVADVTNNDNGDVKTDLAIAAYDAHGNLINMTYTSVMIGKETKTISAELTVPENTEKVKAFLWDGSEQLKPYSEAIIK